MTYHSLEDRIVKNFLRQGDDSTDARIYGSFGFGLASGDAQAHHALCRGDRPQSSCPQC